MCTGKTEVERSKASGLKAMRPTAGLCLSISGKSTPLTTTYGNEGGLIRLATKTSSPSNINVWISSTIRVISCIFFCLLLEILIHSASKTHSAPQISVTDWSQISSFFPRSTAAPPRADPVTGREPWRFGAGFDDIA